MSFLTRLFGYRVRCDICGRTFRPRLHDQKRADGSALRQFQCPHCGAITFVAHISARGVKLSAELQLVRLDAPGARRKIAELQREIRKEVRRWDA